MTTPSKLDEARLRELAEAARKDADCGMTRYFGDLGDCAVVSKEALRELSDAIPALLDALSAERERGDRAVGLIEEIAPFGLNHTSKWVSTKAQIFLATQKAEGAD